MAPQTPPKVVCFDLGGVLVRICRSWDEACSQARLPSRSADWLASEECQTQRKDVADRYQLGQLDCREYYAALSQALRGLYSAREVESIHTAWTLEEYPGVLELIRALNGTTGVSTACLSNTNHAHWQRLAGMDGRREYSAVPELRHRLASHLVGYAKPDPQIYRLAHAKFSEAGAVQAENIFFFDDLADNVSAARLAGWTAFLVDHRGDTALQIREHLRGVGIRC